jgi:N-acetylglucosaminyldiphosphoundecaprenol N-acetyl-beta-D-mannosaminyltransferase
MQQGVPDMFQTYPVIDAPIVGTTGALALQEFIRRAAAGEGGYSCFVNAHVSVMTRQNKLVRHAVADATFAFPDGMPVYLVGKYLRGLRIEKISGPDLLGAMFADEQGRQLKHYFYGGKPEVLEKLLLVLRDKYPACNIVGAVSPPFRALSQEEHAAGLTAIRDSGADIVWVGLGAPKQELWMQQNSAALPGSMLMGVGAAFDFHADVVQRAPEWAQRFGLEWLHRLLQEPGRLWRRYLVTNSLFIYYTALDTFKRIIFGTQNYK